MGDLKVGRELGERRLIIRQAVEVVFCPGMEPLVLLWLWMASTFDSVGSCAWSPWLVDYWARVDAHAERNIRTAPRASSQATGDIMPQSPAGLGSRCHAGVAHGVKLKLRGDR